MPGVSIPVSTPEEPLATAHASLSGLTRRYAKRRDDPSALRAQPSRHGLADAWATPNCLIDVAIELARTLPEGLVWECAAGDLALVARLRLHRTVLASDAFADSNIPGVLRHDFLAAPPLDIQFAAIATNPPFNQMNRFIERGLALMGLGYTQSLMLLLRSDHLFAQRRAPLLARAAELHACCWRPYWLEQHDFPGRWSFVWAIWRAGFTGAGPSTFFWVPEKTSDGSLSHYRLRPDR
jgi:hypothetical protein